ncbi:MAG: hypothetical protein KBD06_00395 [Candidatus Pacebacteria bacterium]|nr:hypothetical protein [Candidatus Paceibacterota bacterium]
MNAFWIKVVAIVAMVVDHFALIYFPNSWPLIVIGRISFPLIAWLVANGAIHTKNINVYMMRLGIFALLAQIPYEIGFYLRGDHPLFLNVLFTLLLGLIAIRILQFKVHPTLKWMGVAATVTLAALLNTDFAAGGVVSIVAFYVFFNRPYALIASQVFILTILTNLSFFIGPGFGQSFSMHPMAEYGILALPLILLYNGKRGYPTGLTFYWFFVAQNFAILLFKMYT